MTVSMTQSVVRSAFIDSIVLSITHAIEHKSIQPASLPIVQMGMRIVARETTLSGAEKKALVIHVVERIARGKDGIEGTQDDVIPPMVVAGLRALIQSQVLDGVIDLAYSTLKATDTKSIFEKCSCWSA